MDFPVEATVAVTRFPDPAAAAALLRSHGFQLTDLSDGQVRVQGSFRALRAVKVRLEQLVLTGPGPAVCPGAGSPPDPEPALAVDPDVFRYVERLRSGDLDAVLRRHHVTMTVQEGGGSATITLQGGDSQVALGSLRRLLHDLSRSLRTQDVPLRDARRRAAPLLDRIRENRNVWGPVLVRETDVGLHLVGPSNESYELKQRLLGTPADQSGSRGRSRSVPPANGRSRGSGGGEGRQGAAGPGQNGPPRRRSLSGTRQQEKKKNGGWTIGPLRFLQKRFRSSGQKSPK